MLGIGLGHAVAGYLSAKSSPIVAVGSAAIDLAPPWLKDWAVGTFGTADKPILVGGVLVVVLLLGGFAGLVQARRGAGAWVLIALAAVAALAAATRSAASPYAALPSVIAGLVAVVALHVALPSRRAEPAVAPKEPIMCEASVSTTPLKSSWVLSSPFSSSGARVAGMMSS